MPIDRDKGGCPLAGSHDGALNIIDKFVGLSAEWQRPIRVALVLVIACMGLLQRQPALAQGVQPGITSPAPGSTISGDVPVFGTALIEPFQKFELHYKLEPSGDDAYIYFTGATSPVMDGQLGVWQASSLAPGVYSLRLRVVKTDGNYAEYYAPNLSVSLGPSPTPTSDVPTPTPIPTATFTPAPQPTPVVGQVEQPALEPTPTVDASVALADQPSPAQPESAAGDAIADNTAAITEDAGASGSNSLTRELGEAVSLARLRAEFLNGVRMSAALLLGVAALYAGKRLFSWVWTQFS